MAEKDIAGFEKLIEPMIMDGYLDNQEEIECMMKASNFGLSGQEAQDLLEAKCAATGAKLERVQKERFKNLIREAVDDKFLDEDEEEELLAEGMNLFDGADSPNELTLDVLEEMLLKERAYTARKVVADIERALKPYVNAGTTISADDWNSIKAREIAMLEGKNVDLEDNEIPVLLDRILSDNGLKVGSGSGGPGGGKALYIAIGAVVLLLLIAVLGGGDEQPSVNSTSGNASTTSTAPQAVSVECPPFDDRIPSLHKKWKEAVEAKRYTTPSNTSAAKYGRELRSACQGYEDGLSPSQQKTCMAAEPKWDWCTLPADKVAIKENNYLRWANDVNNPVSCQTWMQRCLELASGSEPCNARMRESSCR